MQVPRKKKDIKILHLENIYVIIVYKERGEIMGLFSSKPKESEWVEWHPTKPNSMVKRCYFDEKTNALKSGMSGPTWTAGWEFSNFENILFCIDEMERQFKNLSDKMDKILIQNEALQNRCDTLEKELELTKR